MAAMGFNPQRLVGAAATRLRGAGRPAPQVSILSGSSEPLQPAHVHQIDLVRLVSILSGSSEPLQLVSLGWDATTLWVSILSGSSEPLQRRDWPHEG